MTLSPIQPGIHGGSTVNVHQPASAERGQALPLFVLMLVALLGATGLVVDVGGAWAQERSQQKASDVAALAGATKETNGGTRQQILDAALASAVTNGYQPTEVQVNIPPTTGRYAPGAGKPAALANDCSTPASRPCWVEVIITRARSNYFAGIVGQGQWDVGARGVAVGGIANAALNGLAPIMFNAKAVQQADRGSDKNYCDPEPKKCDPQSQWPLGADQYNWTIFCLNGGNCNVNTADVKSIIDGNGYQVTLTLGMDLGAHNQGQHVGACKFLLDKYPTGAEFPVAINDDNGRLLGFWMWHFDPAGTNCNGGGNTGETLSGWFIDDPNGGYLDYDYPLTISPNAPAATFGQYIVRLVE